MLMVIFLRADFTYIYRFRINTSFYFSFSFSYFATEYFYSFKVQHTHILLEVEYFFTVQTWNAIFVVEELLLKHVCLIYLH
jgi:hypothetical protein